MLKLRSRGRFLGFIRGFVVGVVLCLSACSTPKPGLPPIIVNTTSVQEMAWQEEGQATGSLFALSGITVVPEISGKILNISFHSGDIVKKDDLLLEIDSSIIQAQLKKAQAQLELTSADYIRLKALYEKGFYDKADLDKAKASLDIAKADVDQFSAQLEKTLIRAPFTGKIGLRQVSIGQYLIPGTPIADLQALDPLYVEFSVPELYLMQLKSGGDIVLSSRIFPGKTYQGKINAIDSSIDPNTRTIKVRAEVPNPSQILLPGIFVEVTVLMGNAQSVLVIPQVAVNYAPTGYSVYQIVDHKAVLTPIEIGQSLPEGQIIVQKGLAAGNVVITGGQLKIFPGAVVMTQEEAKAMMEAAAKKEGQK